MAYRIGRSAFAYALRTSASAAAAAAIAAATIAVGVGGAAPTRDPLSFPEPEDRWMQVEVSFSDLGSAPLDLRMSRSSPGRYSIHDFAKNVYDVHAFDRDGRELPTTRPDAYGWMIEGHGGAATVKYKVYGDRIDGTYLAIDRTHAHVNMPAAIMWARGLDDRPAALEFVAPSADEERPWTVATQLYRGSTPFEFTAPNLQYLMDSPVEFSPFVRIREFGVGPRRIRFALHHAGTDEELASYVSDV